MESASFDTDAFFANIELANPFHRLPDSPLPTPTTTTASDSTSSTAPSVVYNSVVSVALHSRPTSPLAGGWAQPTGSYNDLFSPLKLEQLFAPQSGPSVPAPNNPTGSSSALLSIKKRTSSSLRNGLSIPASTPDLSPADSVKSGSRPRTRPSVPALGSTSSPAEPLHSTPRVDSPAPTTIRRHSDHLSERRPNPDERRSLDSGLNRHPIEPELQFSQSSPTDSAIGSDIRTIGSPAIPNGLTGPGQALPPPPIIESIVDASPGDRLPFFNMRQLLQSDYNSSTEKKLMALIDRLDAGPDSSPTLPRSQPVPTPPRAASHRRVIFGNPPTASVHRYNHDASTASTPSPDPSQSRTRNTPRVPLSALSLFAAVSSAGPPGSSEPPFSSNSKLSTDTSDVSASDGLTPFPRLSPDLMATLDRQVPITRGQSEPPTTTTSLASGFNFPSDIDQLSSLSVGRPTGDSRSGHTDPFPTSQDSLSAGVAYPPSTFAPASHISPEYPALVAYPSLPDTPPGHHGSPSTARSPPGTSSVPFRTDSSLCPTHTPPKPLVAVPSSAAPGLHMITPHNLGCALPDRVGEMQYDKALCRWIRIKPGSTPTSPLAPHFDHHYLVTPRPADTAPQYPDESPDPFQSIDDLQSFSEPMAPAQPVSRSHAREMPAPFNREASADKSPPIRSKPSSPSVLPGTPSPPARHPAELPTANLASNNSSPPLAAPTPYDPTRPIMNRPRTQSSPTPKLTAAKPSSHDPPRRRQPSAETTRREARLLVAAPWAGTRFPAPQSQPTDTELDFAPMSQDSAPVPAPTQQTVSVDYSQSHRLQITSDPNQPGNHTVSLASTRQQVRRFDIHAGPPERPTHSTGHSAVTTTPNTAPPGSAVLLPSAFVVPEGISWDLSGRRLVALADLDPYASRVEELDASHNCLERIDLHVPHLTKLMATHNRITRLPANAALQWSHLEVIDLSNNQLTSLAALSGLRHLRSLSASHNRITSLRSLRGLPRLETLIVQHNSLAHLDLEPAQMPRLEQLMAAHNSITTLHGIEGMASLRLLNLDYNALTCVHLACPVPQLRTLRLCHNPGLGCSPRQQTHRRCQFAYQTAVLPQLGTSPSNPANHISSRAGGFVDSTTTAPCSWRGCSFLWTYWFPHLRTFYADNSGVNVIVTSPFPVVCPVNPGHNVTCPSPRALMASAGPTYSAISTDEFPTYIWKEMRNLSLRQNDYSTPRTKPVESSLSSPGYTSSGSPLPTISPTPSSGPSSYSPIRLDWDAIPLISNLYMSGSDCQHLLVPDRLTTLPNLVQLELHTHQTENEYLIH
ncbi:hypothetical protein BJ085DRAFT_39077 [Dimargaris cristalligena]|uniref:Uncharacterized protein n=1 Tax=Dimargaris cristalligena TaxID=215637 RepID=A0A4V1J4Q2_9FUNG|nr:hypothetical protein BJ085DRAFT_39077 [Dimargaris cristalligena]|eukprot:RKP36349.1 hypothetical protein BJ085DRAFT_39077 [Dimargaris cristalligena]